MRNWQIFPNPVTCIYWYSAINPKNVFKSCCKIFVNIEIFVWPPASLTSLLLQPLCIWPPYIRTFWGQRLYQTLSSLFCYKFVRRAILFTFIFFYSALRYRFNATSHSWAWHTWVRVIAHASASDSTRECKWQHTQVRVTTHVSSIWVGKYVVRIYLQQPLASKLGGSYV